MRLGLLGAALFSGVVALAASDKEASKWITEDLIRGHVRYLASDLLEGRGPATRGDVLAEAYIASQFEGLGLKPAAPDGGYFQRFDVVGLTPKPTTMLFSAGTKTLTFKYLEDFMAASGVEAPLTKVENAEIVFVGYGIVAPEFKWDDYKGMDLRGKILLMMNNDPEDDPDLFAGKTRLYYGRWDYKYEIAAKMGAIGAIIIHTTPSAAYPWSVVQSSWSGEEFRLPAKPGQKQLLLKAWTTEDATRKIVELAGKNLDQLRADAQKRDFQPVPLGVKASVSFPNAVHHASTANVLGILPGSDSQLSKQLVIYSAHHDHLGVRPGARPGEDAIYNGAVDNASGVAAMLAVARAFTALPHAPKRSVLFAAVGGEEQGLLGSEFLAAHPLGRVRDIQVDINIDGVNTFGRTRDLTVIGLGKTNLDPTLRRLAAEQGGRLLKPDQMPDRGFFYRSDQFNFAKAGVPAVYFESGLDYIGRPAGWGKAQQDDYTDHHYHQPSDELTPTWDLSGAVEDTVLDFKLGLAVANGQVTPAWTPGDEFEAARKASER